ncbi:hypothetical protein AcW1_000950 [Taiwanofungus camphoratus]|nr:hypothetical protein AcW1_000950 [Antrodia cinnamomea]
MLPRSDADVLRDIASIAHTLARTSLRASPTASSLPLSSPALRSDLDSLDDLFPAPAPLTTKLVAKGVDPATAGKFSSAFMKSALRLRMECERQFRRANAACMQGGHNRTRLQSLLQAAYPSKYKKTLESWTDQILIKYAPQAIEARRYHRQSSEMGSASDHKQSRRPFNQGALPILEAFFEHNRHPSRSEKLDLAERTNMDYKQINVWFQNRRNRSKKGVRERPKNDCCTIFPPDLESSVAEIISTVESPDCDDPIEQDRFHISERSSSTGASEVRNTFNLERPLHAYPSSYPPSCSYNPFPVREDVRHFVTPWIRNSGPSSSCRSVSVDVAQLTSHFAKLSVIDRGAKNSGESGASAREIQKSRTASALGFATIAPRAPLSALCNRPSALQHSNPCLDAITIGPSCLHFVTSTGQTRKAIGKQKVAAFPAERLPSYIGFTSPPASKPSSVASGSEPVSSVTTIPWSSHSIRRASSTKVDFHDTTQSLHLPSAAYGAKGLPPRSNTVLSPPPFPVISPSTNDPDVPTFGYCQSYPISIKSHSRRKFVALPKRVPTSSMSSTRTGMTDPASFSPSRSVSTLSRMSSASSISSMSSSASSSLSSSDSDGPPTPPLLPTSLPAIEPLIHTYPLNSQVAEFGLSGKAFVDTPASTEGYELGSLH